MNVELNQEELRTIVGALNNARNFIDDAEFHTVMGFGKDEIPPLLKRLRDLHLLADD